MADARADVAPELTGRMTAHDRELSEGRGLAEQWLGLLLAPAVFFAHLQLAYMMVPWACERREELWIHVTGAVAVLLAAAGTAVAWRAWSRAGREPPGDAGGPVPRARFLAVTGLLTSALFVLLLLSQWVAGFFIAPCQ
ncbi:MAG TPA: hypothetical protein VFS08_08535 [Gemmatimonadaceae bacterium]|nr:hypothetical protein [Gemmatimonadaceae bacterium]